MFSNGQVWTQLLSAALGLGTLAPSGVGAYANTIQTALAATQGTLQAEAEVFALKLATGVSGSNPYIPLVAGVSGGTDYAVGGAVTGQTGENSAASLLDGLSAQFATFQRAVPVPAANALATLSIGGNDVLAVLEDPNFATLYGTGTTLATVAATAAGRDIAQSVSLETAFLISLTGLGLTNAVVMNVPDIGKTPSALGLGASQAGAGTVLSQYYNALLSADIASLNQGGAHIAIDDAFALIDAAVANPAAYSLLNATSPVYSGSGTSFAPASLVSTNLAVQNSYLFFDKLHPTAIGQMALARQAQTALTACFATGTRIGTAAGDVAVEDLRISDRIRLANGETAPAIWIGHRDVDCTTASDPATAWPVRVKAHAFGFGRPSRDLYLSPDHALFIGGVLIPVKYLIEGAAVAPVPRGQVTWWHVELPRHDVLLAEGLPCESFLDTGARAGLGPVKARRADDVSHVWETEACAQLVVFGPSLAQGRTSVRSWVP